MTEVEGRGRRTRGADIILWTSGLVLVGLVLVCFGAPWFARALGVDGTTVDIFNRLAAPDAAHWLGTDELGRDYLVRVLEGGRVSLAVGLIGALAAALIGTVIGVVGAYLGAWLFSLLGVGVGGFWGALVVAIVGAVVLLAIVNLIRGKPVR
jgi:peptide/nickel transport system permease protein